MPANLSPEYLDAEKKFKEAHTPAEKQEALEEMLATIPKHKGTEKMQADLARIDLLAEHGPTLDHPYTASRNQKCSQPRGSNLSRRPPGYSRRTLRPRVMRPISCSGTPVTDRVRRAPGGTAKSNS